MKVISFCLYGSEAKYLIGAVENAREAHDFYPDWQVRIHYGPEIPSQIIHAASAAGATMIPGDPILRNRMFWRLQPLTDLEVEAVIFRDLDSRLSERERGAVQAWIDSGKGAHIIRDFPGGFWGDLQIAGGTWGVRPARFPQLYKALLDANPQDQYGIDERVLTDVAWPIVQDDNYLNDCCCGWGRHRRTPHVGMRYDSGHLWEDLALLMQTSNHRPPEDSPAIHVLTPFSRPHLINPLLALLAPQNIIWHIIAHEPESLPSSLPDWVHVHACEYDNPFDICYWKLNWFLDNVGVISKARYGVLCDDDAFQPDYFNRIRCKGWVPNIITSKDFGRGWGGFIAAPENMRVTRVGFQFWVLGEYLSQHHFATDSHGADGIMASTLSSRYETVYLPEAAAWHNSLVRNRLFPGDRWLLSEEPETPSIPSPPPPPAPSSFTQEGRREIRWRKVGGRRTH